MRDLVLRRAALADSDAIWSILEPILRAGEAFALPDEWSREQTLGYLLQEVSALSGPPRVRSGNRAVTAALCQMA